MALEAASGAASEAESDADSHDCNWSRPDSVHGASDDADSEYEGW